MDKETLSHYGWIVILVLILSVLLALATPFGNFVADGFKAAYVGFFQTGENALGIIIPGAEPHQPNTLYYYQPYAFDFGGGQTAEIVFHKDGTYDIYYNDNGYEWGEIYTGEDSAIYENGTVEFIGGLCDISEDGTQLLFEGNVVATMIPTPIHALYMNSVYTHDYGDGRETLTFKENGSGVYTDYYMDEEPYVYEIPVGEFKYFDEYFEDHFYDEYDGQTYIDRCAVYPNGLKIINFGSVYKIDCQHLNTEIRNKTEDYTGDTYCKDCGVLLEKGMYLTGEAYALYFEDNQMLVFTRSQEEIQSGDIYDGMTVTEVYTGFETDKYSVGGGKSRAASYDEATTPWFSHAQDIMKVRFDTIIKPKYTKAWFYRFASCGTFDLTRLDMSEVSDTSYMFAKSALATIPTMNITTVGDTSYMFENCTNLHSLNGFTMPNGVVIMDGMFYKCQNISDFSSIIIANTVEYMNEAFYWCTNMTKAPNMNNATSVVSMSYAFWNCENLTVAPAIPSAENMGGTFSDCASLTTAPILPSNLKYAYWTFNECPALVTYTGNADGEGNFKNYKIPSGVEDTSYMFYGCKLLTAVPDLDHCTSLEDVSSMFRDCVALINAPKVPNSIVNMSMMFYSCDNLLTAPDLSHCTKLRDMGYAFDYCRKLEVAPIIPYGVTNLKETFEGTSIKTYHGSADSIGDFSNYIIPNTVTDMYGTFSGTPMVISPVIPESVKDMTCTFDSCRKLTKVTINANPTKYSSCFRVLSVVNALNPCENITMYGSSSMLQTLANTCETGKRIIYNANGDILRQ